MKVIIKRKIFRKSCVKPHSAKARLVTSIVFVDNVLNYRNTLCDVIVRITLYAPALLWSIMISVVFEAQFDLNHFV